MNGKKTDTVRQHFVRHGGIISFYFHIGGRTRGGHVRTKGNCRNTGKDETTQGIRVGDMDGREGKGVGAMILLLEVGELHDGFLYYLPIDPFRQIL